VRSAAYIALEAYAAVAGSRAVTPPAWLPLLGDKHYAAIGQDFLRHMVELAGLGPTAHVLEVGCGLGRIASQLAAYLQAGRGRYVGFDVDARAIRWCRRTASSRYPDFEFYHANLRNREYNPWGHLDPTDYRFPYDASSFDFAILVSVFTHMLPREVENYLSQVARVLRPDGRCFMTFFRLNPESRALLDQGRASLRLAHDRGSYRTLSERLPEAAIAHDEDSVRAWLTACRLRLIEPVRYGSWCGRADFTSYQDLMVAANSKLPD
jgi:SAM-dependent methyltransferase